MSRADTISVKFLQVDYGSNVTVTLTPASGTPQTVSGEVGLYKWQQTNGATADGLPNTFYTFCIELLQDITPGTTYPNDYSLTGLTGAPSPGIGLLEGNGTMHADQAKELSALWAQYGSVNSVDAAATFQFAVWDILYGTANLSYAPYAGGGSSIHLSDDVANAAKWATPKSTDPSGFLDLNGPRTSNLFALTSPAYQDQITTAAAPLPSTAFAGAALLAILGVAAAGTHLMRKATTIPSVA